MRQIRSIPIGAAHYPGLESGGWRARAACGECSADEQYQFTDGFQTPEDARPQVVKYCTPCPVRDSCLRWAREERSFAGIAGGVLFMSTRAGSSRRMDRRRTLRVNDTSYQGYVLAVNRHVHPSSRLAHLVEPDSALPKVNTWRGLCGASCTPDRTAHQTEEIGKAARCRACTDRVQT